MTEAMRRGQRYRRNNNRLATIVGLTCGERHVLGIEGYKRNNNRLSTIVTTNRIARRGPSPRQTRFCVSVFVPRHLEMDPTLADNFLRIIFCAGTIGSGPIPRRTHFCTFCAQANEVVAPRRTQFCASLCTRTTRSGPSPKRTHFLRSWDALLSFALKCSSLPLLAWCARPFGLRNRLYASLSAPTTRSVGTKGPTRT